MAKSKTTTKKAASKATKPKAAAAAAPKEASHVDKQARQALRLVGAALAGLSGLDSGEQERVAAAIAATDAL